MVKTDSDAALGVSSDTQHHHAYCMVIEILDDSDEDEDEDEETKIEKENKTKKPALKIKTELGMLPKKPICLEDNPDLENLSTSASPEHQAPKEHQAPSPRSPSLSASPAWVH